MPPLRYLCSRPGTAYLWTLTMVAVLAIIAAVAAPSLADIGDVSRVKSAEATLSDLAAGVDTFNLYAKRGSASFTTPAALSQLTSTITNGRPAGCGTQTYNATAVTNWTAHAPFTTFVVPPQGLWTPIGRVNDAPSRTPATAAVQRTSTSDPYYIQIPSVDVQLARMLDLAVDDTISAATGVVRYTTAAADSTVLVSYLVTLAHSPAC
jgi:Tfp pilus assembly protein PilE